MARRPDNQAVSRLFLLNKRLLTDLIENAPEEKFSMKFFAEFDEEFSHVAQ